MNRIYTICMYTCQQYNIFYIKTTLLLLSTSNLIASKFEATPSSKLLFSSISMSHKNPYPSSALELSWVVTVLLFVSCENGRRLREEVFKLKWLWRVGVEEENEGSLLYPPMAGIVWLINGDDEDKVRGGGGDVVSLYIMSCCVLNLELLSSLLLWKTLHKTQSSYNPTKVWPN